MAMGAHHAGKGHLVRSRTDSRSADRVDCARRMQLPHPKPASAPFRPPISKVPALPLTSFSPSHPLTPHSSPPVPTRARWPWAAASAPPSRAWSTSMASQCSGRTCESMGGEEGPCDRGEDRVHEGGRREAGHSLFNTASFTREGPCMHACYTMHALLCLT